MIDKAVRTLFMKTQSAVLTAADGVRRARHQAGQTLTGNTVRIEGRGVRLKGEEKFKRRRLGNAVQLELPAQTTSLSQSACRKNASSRARTASGACR